MFGSRSIGYRRVGKEQNGTEGSYFPVYGCLKALLLSFCSSIRKRDTRKDHDVKVRLVPVAAGVW